MRTQTNLHSGAGANIDTQQLANVLAANGVQLSPQQLQQIAALAGQVDTNQLMFLLSMYGVSPQSLGQLMGAAQMGGVGPNTL